MRDWFTRVESKKAAGIELLEKLKRLKVEGVAQRVREGVRECEIALKVNARAGKSRVDIGFWDAETLNAVSKYFEYPGFKVRKGLSHLHDQSYRLEISWEDEKA